MNKIKIIQNAFVAVLTLLMCSMTVWSVEQTELDSFSKKDVVDEINRSEIEEEELIGVPQIENLIPAIEMPSFKANVIDSKTSVKFTKPKSKKPKRITKTTTKRSTVIAKNTKRGEKNTASEKPVEPAKLESQSTTKTVTKTRKRKTIVVNKSLKISQILVKDTVVLKNGKTQIQRIKGKYLYKYRLKYALPLESKGLNKLSENHYLVIDKSLLLSDYNKENAITNSVIVVNPFEAEQNLSEEIIQKRRALEKKHNRNKLITLSIPSIKLKREDMIYVFGKVQMVTRKKSGHASAKKYWLYPTIDITHPALIKAGNGKYKVIKNIK